MNFGQIALHPGGDTIIINASNGPSTAIASRSHIEASYSGYIDFTSTDPGEYVIVNYPDSVILSDGSMNITISNIQAYSQLNNVRTELPGGGAIVRFSIGGELTLVGNENESTYSGTINVLVSFD